MSEGSQAINSLPLGVVPPECEPLSSRRMSQLVWCLMLLGLAARVIRYLLCFPLWQDEAYLAANLLDRGYLGLLEPLRHHQVAPILFLWIQATIVRLLGFSEYTLRLFPLVCSLGGLILFWHVARRLLQGTALVFAVGVFAVGYPLVRYACEAKPYGCDMFASLALMAMAVEWHRCRDTRWLWALVVSVPLALGLSYPAVFMAAGVSLAVGYGLWTARRDGVASGWTRWLAWVCYNVATLGGFAGVYALSVGPQSAAELAWMRNYWKAIFPPLGSVLGMVRWFVEVHTSELLQYPVGGARGASTLTTICVIAAVVVLWRRRERWLLTLCLAPLLPNLLAAFAWRYPYGGSVRFVLYMAPAFCLLAGLGAATLIVRRNERGEIKGRPAVLVVAGLLVVVAVGSIARDFASPYRSRDVLGQRDFARWFWFNKEYNGEVACWEIDLAEGAGSPVVGWPEAAVYLCNRRIYSPRHARAEEVHWDRVSAEHPLRVVRYGASNCENDDAAFASWLAGIRSRYDLVDCQRHAFPWRYKDRTLLYYEYLDLYEFVPKGQPPDGDWCSRPERDSRIR
jgi:hypothetical protein